MPFHDSLNIIKTISTFRQIGKLLPHSRLEEVVPKILVIKQGGKRLTNFQTGHILVSFMTISHEAQLDKK